MSPKVIVAIAVIGLVIGASVAIDALLISDQELLERFIQEVSGRVDRQYVDRALGYVDLEAAPLDLQVLLPIESQNGLYDASRAEELEEMFRKRMRPYYGEQIRAFQKRIEIDGEQARVGFTVLSSRLRARVELKMVKLDKRWLVTEARVSQ